MRLNIYKIWLNINKLRLNANNLRLNTYIKRDWILHHLSCTPYCTATPDNSSSSKNINSTARVSRSSGFLWLCLQRAVTCWFCKWWKDSCYNSIKIASKKSNAEKRIGEWNFYFLLTSKFLGFLKSFLLNFCPKCSIQICKYLCKY